MVKERATDYQNFPTFQQLWEALGSKLIEAAQGRLTLNQPVTGSSPVRLTLDTKFFLNGTLDAPEDQLIDRKALSIDKAFLFSYGRCLPLCDQC